MGVNNPGINSQCLFRTYYEVRSGISLLSYGLILAKVPFWIRKIFVGNRLKEFSSTARVSLRVRTCTPSS